MTQTVFKVAERTTSLGVIIGGAAGTCALFAWSIQAFFPDSMLTDAVDHIRVSADAVKILGAPISMVPGSDQTENSFDEDGTPIRKSSFSVRGPRGQAFAHVAVNKNSNEVHYLILDLGGYRLDLIDNRKSAFDGL